MKPKRIKPTHGWALVIGGKLRGDVFTTEPMYQPEIRATLLLTSDYRSMVEELRLYRALWRLDHKRPHPRDDDKYNRLAAKLVKAARKAKR